MPDISEGLSAGGTDPTGDAFAAALAGKFGPEGDPVGALEDTPDEPANEPAEAPARDPESGKFVPKEAQAQAEDTPEPEAEADTSTVDPAVEAYLQRYGGDTAAALKAAAHQTDLIGRQGQELGKTREELAELRGRLEQMAATPQVAPDAALSVEQVEEQAAELANSVGYVAAATQLANTSERGYDALMRNWAIEDPIAAQRFDLDFQLWKREQAAVPAQPPAEDPRLAVVLEAAEVESMGQAIAAVASERGDLWAGIAPFMDAALEQVHPSVLALVASADPKDKLDGTRMIADRAQLLSLSGTNPTATAAELAAEAATARKVAGSAVATGSLRPAEVPAGSPESRAQAIARLKEQIVGADSTNIADGLTFGK